MIILFKLFLTFGFVMFIGLFAFFGVYGEPRWAPKWAVLALGLTIIVTIILFVLFVLTTIWI